VAQEKEQQVGHRPHRGRRSQAGGVARRRHDESGRLRVGFLGRAACSYSGRTVAGGLRPTTTRRREESTGMTLANRPFSRRRTLTSAAAATLCGTLGGWTSVRAATLAEPSAPFTVSWLHQRVHELAAGPFEPVKVDLPPAFTDMSFTQYHDIRFHADQALWRDLNLTFESQFFHLGYQYREPVHVFDVVDGVAREVVYAPALFDYGKSGIDPSSLAALGFSGFRLHYPLNRPDYRDEVAVFQAPATSLPRPRRGLRTVGARLAVNTGCRRARSFRPSAASGSSGRYPAPPRSSSTHCSTVPASPAPTASPSGRARRPPSTSPSSWSPATRSS
jgi:hypothetical protein